MYKGITEVKYLEDYKILLTFENNEQKIFNVLPYLNNGKFNELKEKNLFKTVHVSFDTIEWDNGVDFDPEFLYETSEKIEHTKV